jgi:hypothetical protein
MDLWLRLVRAGEFVMAMTVRGDIRLIKADG